jgi:hypothetical protein
MAFEMSLETAINTYAAKISKQPLGLTLHQPEMGALPTRCFENVQTKVVNAGGRVQFGWMFWSRLVADIPGPGYIVFSHHAVWHATTGSLIDVTPFPDDPKHHPLTVGGSVLFLCDDFALPVVIKGRSTARPNRFFPLSDDDRLAVHLQRLTDAEKTKCDELYQYMETLD